MGCGCSKLAREQKVTDLRWESGAGYPLFGYEGCTSVHRGSFQGSMVYAVARATSDERLFPRSQLAEASAYARSVRGTIEALPTGDLCDEAVRDVYDAGWRDASR